jgi:hypothetical protein
MRLPTPSVKNSVSKLLNQSIKPPYIPTNDQLYKAKQLHNKDANLHTKFGDIFNQIADQHDQALNHSEFKPFELSGTASGNAIGLLLIGAVIYFIDQAF